MWALLLAVVSPIWADVLLPIADTFVEQAAPSANNGAEVSITLSSISNGQSVGLIHFSPIPSNAAAMTLTLHATELSVPFSQEANSLQICRILSGWGESSVNYLSLPDFDESACVTVTPADWTNPVVDVTSLSFGSALSVLLRLQSPAGQYISLSSRESSGGPLLNLTMITPYNAGGLCSNPVRCRQRQICNCAKPGGSQCFCPTTSDALCCDCRCGSCSELCQYYDATPPTVDISVGNYVFGQEIDMDELVTFTFSFKEKTNFGASSFTKSNCDEVRLFGISPNYFLECYVQSENTPITVRVEVGAITDPAGNVNERSGFMSLTPVQRTNKYNSRGICPLRTCRDQKVCDCTAPGVGTCSSHSLTCNSQCSCGTCAQRCQNYDPIILTVLPITDYVHGPVVIDVASNQDISVVSLDQISAENCGNLFVTTVNQRYRVTCDPIQIGDSVAVTFNPGSFANAANINNPISVSLLSRLKYFGEGYCPINATCFDQHVCRCALPGIGVCTCQVRSETCCDCHCGGCAERCETFYENTNWTSGISRTSVISRNAGLSGTLSPKLGDLSALTSLVLPNNLISGRIPTQLGKLTLLRLIDLSYNQLFGPLPTQLAQLQQLTGFNLQGNTIEAPLPPELHFLTRLSGYDSGISPSPSPSGRTKGGALGLSNNALVGVACGVAGGVCIVGGLSVWYCTRSKAAKKRKKDPVSDAKNNVAVSVDVNLGGFPPGPDARSSMGPGMSMTRGFGRGLMNPRPMGRGHMMDSGVFENGQRMGPGGHPRGSMAPGKGNMGRGYANGPNPHASMQSSGPGRGMGPGRYDATGRGRGNSTDQMGRGMEFGGGTDNKAGRGSRDFGKGQMEMGRGRGRGSVDVGRGSTEMARGVGRGFGPRNPNIASMESGGMTARSSMGRGPGFVPGRGVAPNNSMVMNQGGSLGRGAPTDSMQSSWPGNGGGGSGQGHKVMPDHSGLPRPRPIAPGRGLDASASRSAAFSGATTQRSRAFGPPHAQGANSHSGSNDFAQSGKGGRWGAPLQPPY